MERPAREAPPQAASIEWSPPPPPPPPPLPVVTPRWGGREVPPPPRSGVVTGRRVAPGRERALRARTESVPEGGPFVPGAVNVHSRHLVASTGAERQKRGGI